jgi:eukaryotic-like serine/threonine-protein kinase
MSQSRIAVTAPSWAHVKELLHQALALGPEARAKFLDEVCASNAALRAELESLLSVGDGLRPEFLESPLTRQIRMGTARGLALQAWPRDSCSQSGFNSIRKLGEGGMGQVWLAEQTAPVRRPVALKLIKAGMYDETVVQRFQAERQSLAIMDHPSSPRCSMPASRRRVSRTSSWSTCRGCRSPSIAISTSSTSASARTVHPGLRRRAARAPESDHPSRSEAGQHFSVEVDGKPVPRIIDFGLAKATTRRGPDQTLYTRFGQFMGTPGYMSPEQVNPNIRDIDTRTDVYSLGVILYVLLTGLQPFETRRQRPSLDEWLRQLREQEPPTPSASSVPIGRSRSRPPPPKYRAKQLVSQLRGDLDWITMKALERDRERRYGTPAEFAADLRRYLHDEPVLARPASAGYQIRKFIRRHRVAAAVTTGLLLLMTAFSALQTIQLQKITQERDRANETAPPASPTS